jgi:hypothetical protein
MSGPMTRSLLLLLTFTTWSCMLPDDADTDEVVSEVGTKCPPQICGLNSSDLSDGYFHELDLDGAANAEGYSIQWVRRSGAGYKLAAVNGKLTAILTSGVGVPQLTGSLLVGLEIRIRKALADGGYGYRTLSIEAVRQDTDYWAHRADGQPTPKVETYKFLVKSDIGLNSWLCQNGATLVDPTSPVRAMPEHHALIFEGERIDVESLTIASFTNSRWVNIGCAETALAKLQLTGHTHAAVVAGFSTTIPERQTMLKLLTADYCGRGIPFTVPGQSLRWTDDDGTMTLPVFFPRSREAQWGPNGATCLNTPRIDAHPTAGSGEAFPQGVEAAIAAQCPRPPHCIIVSTTAHLNSWNPL